MHSKQLPITSADQPTAEAAADRPQPEYYRSLGELEQSPEFEEALHREFPSAASEFPEGVSRRKWLKLMSASMALGGLAGCRYGKNEIAAFVVRPENTIPGVPKHYATSFELAGRAVNLLATNVDGRPIKLEGNPDHPLMKASEPNDLSGGKERFASAGTDVFSQGCILGLYDPDRLSEVIKSEDGDSSVASWEEFAAVANQRLRLLEQSKGAEHAIVMSPSLSPSVNRLVKEALEMLPEATLVQYSSIDDSAQSAACTQALGKPAELLLDLTDAKIICCLDSDPLGNDPNQVLYSRQFAKGRTTEASTMSRLYAIESRYSVTGGAADSRLPVRSSQIGAFLSRLEQRVDEMLAGGQAPASIGENALDQIKLEEQLERFVDAMAEDLTSHKGAGIVSVGAHQPLEVQLAALRLNQKLGNIGKTVTFMPSRSAIEGVETVGIEKFAQDLKSGTIKSAWILGNNPVYSAPSALELDKALESADVVYAADFNDETAATASWSVPLAHPLESWSDVKSADGTYGIGQPQILPLLNGKSLTEILSLLMGKVEAGEEIVRTTAAAVAGSAMPSRVWRQALHDGFLADSQATAMSGELKIEAPTPAGTLDLTSIDNGDLEVVFATSDTLYDGRFAKNVWMQELPQAMTKIVWDNAAIMSQETAAALGLNQSLRSTTEIVKLTVDGREMELPLYIMPGQAHGSITVHLGYGRVCRDEAVPMMPLGKDANNQIAIGSNAATLRGSDNAHILTGVTARPTSKPYKLATTQDHFAIDAYGLEINSERAAILVREGTVDQVNHEGYVDHLGTHAPEHGSLWEEPIDLIEQEGKVPNQWGMTVDLNKCTGCNSCVVACQAENNIAVVGKEQVSRGREMHWIRIDRYFRGSPESAKIVNQPVACVHCETAPCEQVCPVAATVHTEDGINAMAYNRCIGTRYCANNCPYKVRRFNYFNYNTEYGYFYGWNQRGKLEETNRKLQQLVLNPEVSVRGRGVMEKCTYCVQRVQNGKITARAENRAIEDGEVQTACQAACPTQAIVFGDISDTSSKVYENQHDPRAYEMLGELNIKPRTMYMARVRNTHPRLKTTDQLVVDHGHSAHGDEPHAPAAGKDHGGDHAGEDHSEAPATEAGH